MEADAAPLCSAKPRYRTRRDAATRNGAEGTLGREPRSKAGPPSRRAALAGLGALALAGTAPAAARPSSEPAGLHDLTPDFWRFYDAGLGGEALEARARDLDQAFVAPNAAVYEAAGFGRERPAIDEARLASWLEAFDPLAPAARRVSQMLPDAWTAHEARFRRAFPAYRNEEPVYLLVSLFDFDLHAETWRGRPRLFIGVDGVAKRDGEAANLALVLDREVFHLYQAQANPRLWTGRSTPLWVGLWREGLASYASAQLNPDAGLAEVLMSRELASLKREEVRPLAAAALASLETTDPAVARRFLQAGAEGDRPARSGYLLGYRLAEHAGRALTLDALARLPAAKVHTYIRKELAELAHG